MTLLIVWFFFLWVAGMVLAYEEGRSDALSDLQRPRPTALGKHLKDDWQRALFQVSHQNIQWSKDRAWATVQGLVLVLGGLSALSHRSPFDSLSRYWFWTFIGLVATAAARYLWELQRSAERAQREAADALDATPGTDRFRYDRTVFDWRNRRYAVLQFVIVAMATVLAIGGIR